jgi:hypothetical protein
MAARHDIAKSSATEQPATQSGTLARQLRCKVLQHGHERRLLILLLEDKVGSGAGAILNGAVCSR